MLIDIYFLLHVSCHYEANRLTEESVCHLEISEAKTTLKHDIDERARDISIALAVQKICLGAIAHEQ